jgi:hypothetical protein
MATLTAPSRRPEEDEDSVGQRHFDDVVGGARSPEDLDTQDSPDEEAAIKRMRDQEQGGGGSKDDRGVSDREGEPERFTFRNGQEAYDRSKKHTEEAQQRGQRKRRGLFIGIGAGGGIISIFAGMMTLLPFKMPALMDFVTDFAGERVEDVLLHESEKIMLRFFLRGSNAAIANGDVIVTGNPIGRL